MSKKYLDKDGLTYFWSKTKQLISDSQENLVDLYSNQTITGSKTFNSDTFYNGSVNATDITANNFIGNLTGNADTSTKWSTARTLTLAGDYSGSVSIDGSSNVTLTGYNYGCYIKKTGTYKLPWNHIAHIEGAGSYADRSIILLITRPYIHGSSGIITIDLRLENQTSTAVGYKYAYATAKWLVRDTALDVDMVKVGVMNVAGAWSADVFIKSSYLWEGVTIKQLVSGGRGYSDRTWTLLNTTETPTTSTNCYETIESYKTYSDIYTASDVGVVNKANSLTVTSIGSATKPVYIDTNGVPTACTYTLGKSVPSNAVFTDTWRGIQNNLTSTSISESLSAYQGTLLNNKKTEITKWTATVKCATWSRLCYVAKGNPVVGSSFILDINGTRNDVVYHDTFIIKAHHSRKALISKLSGSSYGSQIQLRVVGDSSGNCYVELYDAVNNAANTTTQSVICRLIEIYNGVITTYTAFTDGTTLPTNFTVNATLKTNANEFQGHLTWDEITGKPSTYYTLTAATSSSLGGVKIGANITNTSGTISISKTNVVAALGYTPPTTNTTYNDVTDSTHGLMSAADKAKLDGIASGANKYTYTHPAGSAANKTSGLYKISTDATSHISGVTAVTKSDITALGIPAADTWRGIQNNLTSTSTTDSLAAAQGKILNEKFSSYLPLTGGDLTGPLYLKYLPNLPDTTAYTEMDVAKTNASTIKLTTKAGNAGSILTMNPGGISLNGTPGSGIILKTTGSVVSMIYYSHNVLNITGCASSSSTTGALVVNGGVGISGALNVGNISTSQISFGASSDIATILLDSTSGLKISRQGSSIALTGSAVKIKASSTGAWTTGSGTVAHINSSGELVKYSSSKRYKTNFHYDINRQEYHNELMQFKPLEYSYKSSPQLTERGMIAEDVEKINPNLVVYDDNTKLVESYKDRDVITMLIVEAQEKDKIINQQQKQINELTELVNYIID